MATNSEETRDLLNLSYVKRWVIAPMHREQSVLEHTARVYVIAQFLSNSPGVFLLDRYREQMAWRVFKHDAEEVYTGDVPGTAKDAGGKEWPNPSTLDRLDVLIKVADSLETFTWWRMHGDRDWNHPNCPRDGDDGRDFRKIRWYCQNWPELLLAAYHFLYDAMGMMDYAEGLEHREVVENGIRTKNEALRNGIRPGQGQGSVQTRSDLSRSPSPFGDDLR